MSNNSSAWSTGQGELKCQAVLGAGLWHREQLDTPALPLEWARERNSPKTHLSFEQ